MNTDILKIIGFMSTTQHQLWILLITIAVFLFFKESRKLTLIAVLLSMILNHNLATNELFFHDKAAFDREFELSLEEFLKTIPLVGFMLYLVDIYIFELIKKALAETR